jgi:hypothetical protein
MPASSELKKTHTGRLLRGTVQRTPGANLPTKRAGQGLTDSRRSAASRGAGLCSTLHLQAYSHSVRQLQPIADVG